MRALVPLALLVAAVPAGQLSLDLRGDTLFASSRQLNLIQPRLLAKLKQGGTVAFDFQLSLWVGSSTMVSRRAFERFVVSYDLWEERFAVTTLRGTPVRATGLAAANVANWCLQNVSLPMPKLQTADEVRVKLEVRAAENRRDLELSPEEGVSLTQLIDVFSQRSRGGEARWTLDSTPVTLAALRARESAGKATQ
ncbi:MAG: hypothetical protein IT162_16050 [Bryobacterales bacterium]|nr:hypothetical protein [Bryobacterales bacterium]